MSVASQRSPLGFWVTRKVIAIMVPTDAPLLVVGRGDSGCIRVKFLRRTHPSCADFWDGNWVSVRVQIRVGGFEGRVLGDLRADELAEFREQVASLYATLKGEAALETMETWLSIRLTADRLGHMEVRGFLRDTPGTGNRLDFAFTLDQTDLPTVLEGLDAACRQYPVIGRP